MSRAAAMLLAAVALSACEPDVIHKSIQVRTRLSVDEATCGCATPDGCPLDCGGAIGVFAIDPLAADPQKQVLDKYCVTFAPEPDDTLRKLSSHLEGMSFDFEEGTTLALQLVVYPGIESPEDPCPFVSYRVDDATWDPTPSGQVPRYAARSAAVKLQGDQVTFELPIGCPFGVFPECGSSTGTFRTWVTNLSTQTLLSSAEAAAFDVHTAQLYDPQPGSDPLQAGLTPVTGLTLDSTSPDALFFATSASGFGIDERCIGTVVTRILTSGAVSTASCEGTPFEDQGEISVEAQSYYVEKEEVDEILADLGYTEFPDGGLVIGRLTVIGDTERVYSVRPKTGTADVYYYQKATTGHLQRRSIGTNESWFVAENVEIPFTDPMSLTTGTARCCETFEAVDADGMPVPSLTFAPIGQINNVVTATTITVINTGSP